MAPFGLPSALSAYMSLVNHVLKPIIGECVVMYFDGMLVYNKNEKEHTHHLYQVLSILALEKIYGNLKKCHFFSSQVIFLGYVVLAQGIHVDVSKIKPIREWPNPTSIQQVQSFNGLASFL